MAIHEGLMVLDLSWGISGPMTTMLLADQGADVTRIERPGGDPFGEPSGYRVWHRGKRSAVLDLTEPADHERFLALARRADVLVESFSPGTTERLGIDFDTLAALNPRLVYCSITGYGATGPDADRPGIGALVAARTGHQYEVRGTLGGTISRLSGREGMLPGVEQPDGVWVGPDRDGPLFSGTPWVDLGAFYVASIGITAALRARQVTGRGQRVDASLLDGVLLTSVGAWVQVDDPDVENFLTWIPDPRTPRGFFRGSDGRWLHNWVPLPEFVINADAADMQPLPSVPSPKKASYRVSPAPHDMVVLFHFHQQMVEAMGRHPVEDWVRVAAQVGTPLQPVRSPEEALLDPLLVEDGCVVDVPDPEHGAVRQVGRVIDLERHPQRAPTPAPARGQHTAEVRAEADRLLADGTPAPAVPAGRPLSAPLEGITVLDLGVAVAGPFGAQVLAQLGARVIKVNSLTEKFWYSNHIAQMCNRDKESIALDLKDPAGLAVLKRLVEQADVVQHNMRYAAAERLGIDYESLRAINPRLVYCHTIGHEQGPREQNPGNDQTGAALGGTSWLDGGLDDGGRPIWSNTSLGDTGNGLLSALGIMQALMDRERTGEGQFVRTSILYAHLLHTSTAWVTPDGAARGDRQRPDAEQYGWSALYRLYRTADDWICLAALDDASWPALCGALERPDLATDPRFATRAGRAADDAVLVELLEASFRTRTSAEWFAALDSAGVPCEVPDLHFADRLFSGEDPRGPELLSPAFPHRAVGHTRAAGLLFRLSDTPGVLRNGPVWPGEHSRLVLGSAGYGAEEIDKLIASGVVDDTALPEGAQ
ncbi:CaiB/BaiF CoA transferase family protein [Trujillonella endophytica]|uniref:Crotonobetainyl-CoA:carnitine CoA-transferase CaiB n=1 Tax=Trujillonella endophytica TaxID=673521 RepID=A0A1H8VYC2_9ACTN|nr:CoA transferase [Trujillella endophytica]SEP20452.1 Crotonobetainyl-CoA:carnitine CoA-transferase CaiB [Trujillella endophytica]